MNITAITPSRRLLFSALAVLLVGGTLVARLWSGAAAEDRQRRVQRLLTASGGEAVERPINLVALAIPLEAHPAREQQTNRPYLTGLLAKRPVIMLNFWASWCPPCLQELRSLQRLGRRLRPYDVQIVAVSYDDSWAPQLRVFKELLGTPVPSDVLWLRDPQGQEGDVKQMMRTALGTEKLPETWILQGDRVVSRFIGAQDWSKDKVLRYLIALSESQP